eukprot:74945_1
MSFADIEKRLQRYKDKIYRDIVRNSKYTLVTRLNGLLRTGSSQRDLTETSMSLLYDSLLNLSHTLSVPTGQLVCITHLPFNIRVMLVDIFGDPDVPSKSKITIRQVAIKCLQSHMKRIHSRKQLEVCRLSSVWCHKNQCIGLWDANVSFIIAKYYGCLEFTDKELRHLVFAYIGNQDEVYGLRILHQARTYNQS